MKRRQFLQKAFLSSLVIPIITLGAKSGEEKYRIWWSENGKKTGQMYNNGYTSEKGWFRKSDYFNAEEVKKMTYWLDRAKKCKHFDHIEYIVEKV